MSRGPFGFAQGRLFDCVAASLREAATPLRMAAYLRRGSLLVAWIVVTSHAHRRSRLDRWVTRLGQIVLGRGNIPGGNGGNGRLGFCR